MDNGHAVPAAPAAPVAPAAPAARAGDRGIGGGSDLTIDELARTVRMTARNVRAYASRGLLPPPRLVGRTGYYGAEHVARLQLVQDLLAEGYTLAAVERVLAEAPADASAATLALHRALIAPWLPEEPEDVEPANLAQAAGGPLDGPLLTQLEDLGLITRLPDGRLRLHEPTLVRAGLNVVRLGIDAADVLRVQVQVTEHARAAAQLYVDLFRQSVWARFAAHGAPESELPEVLGAVERVQPVASTALLASFRRAMADAIAAAMGEELERLPHQHTDAVRSA